MTELLKTLCRLDGVTGQEDTVRAWLRSQAEPYADRIVEDPAGNLLVFRRGARQTGRVLMLAAHMDEVGLIVKSVTDEGFLRFATAGGIDGKVLPGVRVRFGDVRGVIGVRPTHLNTDDDEKKPPRVRDMAIDIGASSREEAAKLVALGDTAAFDNEPFVYGDMLMAKAIDDRIGCAVLLRLLREPQDADCWYAFTVQEEAGLRGASAAAHRIRPDVGIVVEGTTAGDLPDVKGALRACAAGDGPVLPVMDRMTLYDPALLEMAHAVAAREGIRVQTKTWVAGGTDAGRIHRVAGGARMLGVAAAVRYIHTPSSAVALDDIEPLYALTRALQREVLR